MAEDHLESDVLQLHTSLGDRIVDPLVAVAEDTATEGGQQNLEAW